MAENKKENFYLLHVMQGGSSILMIPEAEFNLYFDKVSEYQCKVNHDKPHGCRKLTRPANEVHPRCNCERWDSFICNHELNHAKSNYSYGIFNENINIVAIYMLYEIFPNGKYT